ncbi:MAG: UDP-N-acetylmuramoyl-tripeptide--D-alanyl-D-alanine ligase [Phycisphaerae bacterium]|nr:UDP-N-acetylmuramoyl-tripeptide--D-alanyl-D-alanine ligase [Phycisphaerae bacterium]NIW73324.1 UDP-N-acetylmuramoyl-tripeptide--D-alanyl-D-alanine ligase [candidate division KSB1 bacterium]NIS53905.1 UDP-N-acetylmuramoyl-tripeptide--D-alanyl-D-alanine ligase [Phycisphaerae bacterium]NIU11516.1 UDP-N-acetylmuramoyl-tripeptide--D-alanyl-D-alanine ligase [Phycisphaerae bacterium]NIU59301.1 UDP-N-acetylmuramoyl-tripeptide--D-alanyl-D-alanine ligase [Phycisphaerae bacterium]
MKEISVNALAQIIKAEPAADIDDSVVGVSTDSRTVNPGDCFFAIAGDNFDGHNYVKEAFAKGAVCAVVSQDVEGGTILKVDDTTKALGDLARHYRQKAGYKVVAITGSVGKTTTRQIVYHVLSQHFRVSQAKKNFNNQIGLPLTLLDAEEKTQIVVAELGTNYPGEIAYLTRIASPDIAVITSVYSAHLDGLCDLQTIVQEKLSISEGLQPNGVFIINGDFEQLVDSHRAKSGKIAEFYTFGKSDPCDYRARDITYTGFGSSFTIDGTPVKLPLAGPGNVDNALAAWAVCSKFGLTAGDFSQAVKTQPPVSMRAELLQIGTLTVLNDCYNANPASVKNALDILTNLDSDRKRRLVFVCGDMAELGPQTEDLHAQLGPSIAKAGVKLLMAVGKYAKIAADAAEECAEYDLQTKCFDDTLSACNNLKDSIKDYDIILVKGSRTAKLEMAVDKLKQLFS